MKALFLACQCAGVCAQSRAQHTGTTDPRRQKQLPITWYTVPNDAKKAWDSPPHCAPPKYLLCTVSRCTALPYQVPWYMISRIIIFRGQQELRNHFFSKDRPKKTMPALFLILFRPLLGRYFFSADIFTESIADDSRDGLQHYFVWTLRRLFEFIDGRLSAPSAVEWSNLIQPLLRGTIVNRTYGVHKILYI